MRLNNRTSICIVSTLNFFSSYYESHRYVGMYIIAEVTSYHHLYPHPAACYFHNPPLHCFQQCSPPPQSHQCLNSTFYFIMFQTHPVSITVFSWLVTCMNKVGGNRCWSVPQDFIQLIKKLTRFWCSACLPIVVFDYLVKF